MSIEGLSAQQRAALLSTLGIDLQSAPTAPSFDPRAWGFPRTLPDADTLFAAFARRARRPSTKDVAAGPDGPHGSQQQQEEESYLVSLQQSRTFQSPDCADSQAAAFGAAAELRCLRGSLLSGGPAPSEEGVASLRAHVKGRVASAWSDEALRRGVALAKAGDTEGAMPCYNQAISLWPRNTDAFVARGAALANQSDLQRAGEDLEAALELDPGHANAARYLATIKARAASVGLVLRPRTSAAQRAEAARAQAQPTPRAAPPPQQAQRPAPARAAEAGRAGGARASSSPSSSASDGVPGAGGSAAPAEAAPAPVMDLTAALQVYTEHYKKTHKRSRKEKDRKKERRSKKKKRRREKDHKEASRKDR